MRPGCIPGCTSPRWGPFCPAKQELDSEVVGRADRAVCNRREQCLAMGDLQHAAELLKGKDDPAELGELTSGRARGRQSPEEITVCDLTGTGVQDISIANLALTRALGSGTRIDN